MKVLSIEQMTKLKELGVDVKPKGECLIYQIVMGIDILTITDKFSNDDVAAFSLQDIVELLPHSIKDKSYIYNLSVDYYANQFTIHYTYDYEPLIQFDNNSFLQAAYEMLIWVIENGYLKTK